jgi:hypothetical protein
MSPVERPVASRASAETARTQPQSDQIRAAKDPRLQMPLSPDWPVPESPAPKSPRRRISGRTLDDIQTLMSEEDRGILLSVQALRLATGAQLRRLMAERTEATSQSADRTARRTLQRLGEWRVLDRMPARAAGGRGGGSDSYAWFVGPAGRRLLDRMGFVGRRLGEPSDRYVRHTLGVSETVVRLIEAHHGDRLELLGWEGEPACWRHFLGYGGGRITLKPDLAVRIAAGALDQLSYFIEYDLSTESVATLEKKLRRHLAYRATGTELRTHSVDPKVLWLVPDQRRYEVLEQLLGRLPARDRELFGLATHDQVVAVLSAEASS